MKYARTQNKKYSVRHILKREKWEEKKTMRELRQKKLN